MAETIKFEDSLWELAGVLSHALHALSQNHGRLLFPIEDVRHYIQAEFPEYSDTLPDVPAEFPESVSMLADKNGHRFLMTSEVARSLRHIQRKTAQNALPLSSFLGALASARNQSSLGPIALLPNDFGCKGLSVIEGSIGTQRVEFTTQLLGMLQSLRPSMAVTFYSCSRQGQAMMKQRARAHVRLAPSDFAGWRKQSNTGPGHPADLVVVFEAEQLTLRSLAGLCGTVSESTALLLIGDSLAQPPGVERIYGQVVSAQRETGSVIGLDQPQFFPWHNQFHPLLNADGAGGEAHHLCSGSLVPESFMEGSEPVHFYESGGDIAAKDLLCQISSTAHREFGVKALHVLLHCQKGALDADRLNQAIQDVVSPGSPEGRIPQVNGRPIAVGDRLSIRRVRRNDRWAPGELAVIKKIDREDGMLSLNSLDGVEAEISFSRLPDLSLGWASSEYQPPPHRFTFVVLALGPNDFSPLWSSFYKALSMAECRLVVIGSPNIWNALKAAKPTVPAASAVRLVERLRECC